MIWQLYHKAQTRSLPLWLLDTTIPHPYNFRALMFREGMQVA
jgi:hypothetical protein